MQCPEFVTAASLLLVIHGFPGIVVVHHEPGDTSCMNLVTFADALLCYCSVQILALSERGLHRVARTCEINFWLTLIIAVRCNSISPYSLQPVPCCCA